MTFPYPFSMPFAEPRDPDFSSVALLMHFDGANNGTVFADNSIYAVTPTRVGSVITTDTKKMFGSASGYFNGSGARLTVPYTTGKFRWWDVPYTIECWINANAFGATRPNLIHNGDGGTIDYWSFGPVSGGALQFYYYRGSATAVSTGSGLISLNSWHHIAMTQSAGSVRLFIDGSLQATAAYSPTAQDSPSYPLVIGRAENSDYNGYIDDLRITRGVARYTSSFSVPTRAFPNS